MIESRDKNLGKSCMSIIRIVWMRLNCPAYDRAKDVVASMIKRLAHRNANVQLYTLEVISNRTANQVHAADALSQLANSLSQNCGPTMHRELASRSFTDAILRLASDRVWSSALKNVGYIRSLTFGVEHSSASESKDLGALRGMGRDVCQRSGSGHHGTGIHEAEESKSDLALLIPFIH